jgi:hypothetical protein
MSNASIFRRAAYVETMMLNACCPKAAASTPAPTPDRRPAPLTFTLADLKEKTS